MTTQAKADGAQGKKRASKTDDDASNKAKAHPGDADDTDDESEEAEDHDDLRREILLSRFWRTAREFWTGPRRRLAWLLTITLLLIVVFNTASSYAMNRWNRAIFDALEQKDTGTVLFLSLIYFAILAVSVAVSVAQVYARMTLQRRWRNG